jgi:hypothetical protein
MVKVLFRCGLVVFLTLLTQIGGLAYLIALFVGKAFRLDKLWKRGLAFLTVYSILSVGAVFLAPAFGRVPLPCLKTADVRLAVQSPLLCALNRHYVTPEMMNLATGLAGHLDQKFPDTLTLALDGNFPFLDGFPLLPHLSHNDGKKLDLAFYYTDSAGNYLRRKTSSPLGYWGFTEPIGKGACNGKQDWKNLRWNMEWFQFAVKDYRLEDNRTRTALKWLVNFGPDYDLSKALLEPHIKKRLGVKSNLIRFQGCRAARHDDHMHIQIR